MHLPCRGWGRLHAPHIVDVPIAPGQNPEAIAKKLLNMGWTIGRKLRCPDAHKRKEPIMAAQDTRERAMGTSSDIALAAAAPIVSPAAGRARRLVYMALEEYYDEIKRAYKPPNSDASIAKECNVSEQLVANIREESYGPLAEPNEVKALRDLLLAASQTLTETTERCVREVRAAASTYGKTLEDVDRRFTNLARKNGWSE